jgi:hypothetical protein
MNQKPKTNWLAQTLIVVGVLCLVAYVAGYYLSSATIMEPNAVYRHFGYSWRKNLYAPAGWLESKATGRVIPIADGSGAYFFFPFDNEFIQLTPTVSLPPAESMP